MEPAGEGKVSEYERDTMVGEKRQGGNTCGHILFLPVGREGWSCDSLAALSGIEGRDPCL